MLPLYESARDAVNRVNAQRSTGPKTDAGKQRSSLNALRHGLTGQVVVLPTEDLAAYVQSLQEFQDEFKPVGKLETQIVQSLADDAWRLNRAKAIETNVYALGLHDHSGAVNTDIPEVRDALAVAVALGDHSKALANLSLHQNRISRAFDRGLLQLRTVQAERRQREEQQLTLAADLYQLHVTETQGTADAPPYDPTADGFVFTVAQIQRHVHFEQRCQRAAKARISTR